MPALIASVHGFVPWPIRQIANSYRLWEPRGACRAERSTEVVIDLLACGGRLVKTCARQLEYAAPRRADW